MPKSKKRTPFYATLATWMMAWCLIAAGYRLIVGLAPAFDPALSSAEIGCSLWHCELDRDPRRLLVEVAGPQMLNTDIQGVRDVISQAPARVLIGAAAFVREIPWTVIFVFLGLAFLSVRQRRNFAIATARLRAAALAALVASFLEPLAATMHATALSPLLLGRRQFFFLFDASDVLWGIMVAGTAFVVIWVMEQALATERELAKIV